MARATSSLPVPDSPVMSTVLLVGAIVSISWKTASIGSLLPMMLENWCEVFSVALEQHVLLLQPPALELLADRTCSSSTFGGLLDVVGGAEPQCLDRGFRRRERGHDDADESGIDALGRRSTSTPVMSGILMSEISDVDGRASSMASAARPFSADEHVVASRRSTMASISRIDRSSSTTRTAPERRSGRRRLERRIANCDLSSMDLLPS